MTFKEIDISYLNDLVKLFVDAFNSEPWNDKWTMDSASKRLNQMMNCEGFYGLAAYSEDKLIGLILGNHEYYYDGMDFVVKEFCVDRNIKGKGIGSILLEEFTRRLKDREIKRIVLNTCKGEATEGFYLKKGFRTIEDMIFMTKEI